MRFAARSDAAHEGPAAMPSAAAPDAQHAGFAAPVPRGGYLWWYVDALSDDGRHGLTLIAFVGSVFSPYYAWARRRGAADPDDYCALNVAFYGAAGRGWTLTERGRNRVERSANRFAIGPSALDWDGEALSVRVDEVTVPLPSRVRGVVRVRPQVLVADAFGLDAGGRHRWRPIAPRARVEVVLEQPRLRWTGLAYLDSNAGTRALEDDFVRWDWSRAALADGATAVLYEVSRRDGGALSLAVRIDAAGTVRAFDPPPRVALPPTQWRVARSTRADLPHAAAVARTLEDTPFYARSLLATHLLGERATAMHESLSLDRFRAPWVQALLPFRMPRRAR
jgi:carotenoid 1,2-hydratase